MNFIKNSALIFTALIAITSSNNAIAGYKANGTVQIGSTYFKGGLNSARNSSGTRELITCLDKGTSITCSARTKSGKYKTCVSSNQVHIDSVRGIGMYSWIKAEFNSQGICTNLWVNHASHY